MKKKLLIPLKLLLTLLILWWVFKDNGREKLNDIRQAVSTADPIHLTLGFLVYFFILALAICRWQLLLRVQGIQLSAFRATWLTSIGMFFNTFLPGATGGDVLKAWYLSQAAPDRKAHAILSIAVDRIIGLMGLIILQGVAVLLYARVLLQMPKTKPIVFVVLATVTASIAGIILLTQRQRLTHSAIGQWVWKWMPAKELLKKLSQSIDLYHDHPLALLGALFISLGIHSSIVLAAWFIGTAIHIQGVSLFQYYVYCPLINAYAAIPATPGGLGLREQAFQFFFSLNNVPPGQALALSLLCYTGMLILGLAGGIIYVLIKPEGTPTSKSTESPIV